MFASLLVAPLLAGLALAQANDATATGAASNATSSASMDGACAIGCATQALPVVGCNSFTDFQCYCTNQKFIDTAIACLGKTCPDSYQVSVAAVKAVCTANNQDMTKVTFPEKVPTGGSSGTTPTTTGTSTTPSTTSSSSTPAPATPGAGSATPGPKKSGASSSVALSSAAAVFATALLPLVAAALV